MRQTLDHFGPMTSQCESLASESIAAESCAALIGRCFPAARRAPNKGKPSHRCCGSHVQVAASKLPAVARSSTGSLGSCSGPSTPPLATWRLDSLAVARRALPGPAYRAPRLGPIHRPARGARFRVFDFPGRSGFPVPIRGCSRRNAQQADRGARGQCREHELAARWPAAKPRLLHVGSGCLDRGALVCG